MKKIVVLVTIILLYVSCSKAEDRIKDVSNVPEVILLKEDTKDDVSGPLEQPVSSNAEISTNNSAVFEEAVSREIPLIDGNTTLIENTPFVLSHGLILYNSYVTKDAHVIDDNVRLRTEPNLHCDTITYLNTGDNVKVFGKTRESEQIDNLMNYWYNIVLDDGREGWMYGAYLRTNIDEMELQNTSSIVPEDLKIAGIERLTSISELADMLSDNQLEIMSKIRLDIEVESLSGLERFTNLQTLDLKNVHIKDVTGVVLSSPYNNWLSITESEIGSLDGVSEIENLYYLSLNGSTVNNLESIIFPDSLKVINLSNFSQYKEVLDYLPSGIEQIYLNENGIQSLSEVEFLKDKYSKLIRLFVVNNEVPLEKLIKEREEWTPVELVWWEGV